MLKPRNIPDIFLGALLAAMIFAFGFGVALTFYPPQKNETARGTEQSGNAAGSDDRLANYTLALDFLNFFLVISTIGLWLATRRSASIAERALTELERPVVALEVLQLGLSFTDNGTITSPVSDFKYQFANYGRTPARLTELLETWPIVDRMDSLGATTNLPEPIDPTTQRGRPFPAGIVIGSDKP